MAWWRRCVRVAPLLAAWCLVAAADRITVDGTVYEDVYVREGGLMYYVELPEGRVLSVAKAHVDASAVVLTADAAQREALHAAWEARREPRETPASATVSMAEPGGSGTASGGTGSAHLAPVAGYAGTTSVAASGGMVGRVSLKNVPLRDALDAILRPLNLDYSVQDDFIWISTPEKIRTESFEDLETRVYSLKGAGMNDTLPKIVLRGNASSRAATGAYGGGAYGRQTSAGGYGSLQTGGQSYGQASFREPGVAGSRYSSAGGRASAGSFARSGGGYGYGSRGGYGSGGGYPSPGAFQGGYGGGYGYGGPVPQFSNISDLFSTIDDRLVGETPAVIGVSR